MSEVTTIQVRPATRERLAKLGKKGQTYDDIIGELLNIKEASA